MRQLCKAPVQNCTAAEPGTVTAAEYGESVSPTTAAPLTGITVLEVGTFLAAPFATMHLADLGARVIKVEDPAGGDTVRAVGPLLDGESSAFIRLNRNKQDLALDLKTAEGAAVFRRLAGGADVLIENLRPGTMTRLGLGYEELRALNPRLVYASASGWGQSGPLAPLAGLDVMAQARSGLMSITGTPGGGPAKVGVPVCDLGCALYIALAVTAALFERDRSGEGQYIDVSLYEAGVSFGVWEAGRFFATGEAGEPQGSAHQSLAPYQALAAADGFVTAGAVTPRTWEAFCAVLGLPQLRSDPRFATASTRFEHRGELIPLIEEVTSRRTAADLIRQLEAAGVPCAPIADYSAVFTDEHLISRDFFWEAPHRRLGPVRQVGSPMRFSRTPARRDSAGPPLGADSVTVLRSAGLPDAEIEDLRARRVIRQAEGTTRE
jgi:crotonobetainyl-CoA:carnitine CoA-transferase CaiB-like acyl-CoA transferase